MDIQHIVLLGRHLSEIQEEASSREHSSCRFPPIMPQRAAAAAAAERHRQAEGESGRETLVQQQERERCAALQEHSSLLDELCRIEAELREAGRLQEELRREAEFLRLQENRLRWENLCYLNLNQRVTKPWVSSYFRKFPMHIYCLPIQPVNHRDRGRGLRRRR